jgi:flagellar hook-associated protein 3 FlgL
MRVTSNTYTNLITNSSQSAQQQLATIQQQISTGDSVQFASDNPLAYEEASQSQTSLAQLNAYTAAAAQATSLASTNNSAMTSLHQIVAQASELATSVTTNMSASQLQAIGTQMTALVNQLTSVANQQSANGTYLFGGTKNQPPITSSGTYNYAANGQGTTIEVQPGNAVQTGIAAGGSGTPPADGFLYDSSTGVDVLGSLQQAATDLNAGNATAVLGTDLPALNKALDHVSLYVGSTAASMSAIQTASQTLQQQTTSQSNQLNSLTQTNLPDATLQLQQIQTQYQASLEAGSRILGLSILNYISSVPTT